MLICSFQCKIVGKIWVFWILVIFVLFCLNVYFVKPMTDFWLILLQKTPWKRSQKLSSNSLQNNSQTLFSSNTIRFWFDSLKLKSRVEPVIRISREKMTFSLLLFANLPVNKCFQLVSYYHPTFMKLLSSNLKYYLQSCAFEIERPGVQVHVFCCHF